MTDLSLGEVLHSSIIGGLKALEPELRRQLFIRIASWLAEYFCLSCGRVYDGHICHCENDE